MARARSLWTGSLSFGLVNVPVSLVSAERDQAVHFNQIHAKTHERLHVAYICTKENAPVDYSEIAHGFDTGDGYVLLTDDELAVAQPEKTRTIEISEFVEMAQVDPILFDHPYYLLPAGEGEGPLRAYRLLVDVLADAEKVAIGQFVLRTKEYLVALRAVDDAIVLETLYYNDEVIDPDELEGIPHDIDVSDRELKIARQLIESLATEFEPERYRDEYRERVLELIEKKAEGQEIVLQPQTEEPAQVVDLMAALEASLAAVKDAKDEKPAKASRSTKKK